MFGAFVLLPHVRDADRPRRRPLRVRRSRRRRPGSTCCPAALLGFLAGPLAGRLGTRYGSRLPLVARHGPRRGRDRGPRAAARASAGRSRSGWCFIGIGMPFAFAAMAKLIVDACARRDRRRDRHEHGHAHDRRRDRRAGRRRDRSARTRSAHTHVPAESAFIAAFWVSAIVAAVGARACAHDPGALRPATAPRLAD